MARRSRGLSAAKIDPDPARLEARVELFLRASA
jgi:hypothetical protein